MFARNVLCLHTFPHYDFINHFVLKYELPRCVINETLKIHNKYHLTIIIFVFALKIPLSFLNKS